MNINKWLSENRVDCRRGSLMGDRGDPGPCEDNYKFYLQRIVFVDYDYDKAGTYWGGGFGSLPLYGFMGYTEDGIQVRGFVRAKNRAQAKEEIISEYPNARFYR